jgi:hypothetical protein
VTCDAAEIGRECLTTHRELRRQLLLAGVVIEAVDIDAAEQQQRDERNADGQIQPAALRRTQEGGRSHLILHATDALVNFRGSHDSDPG